MSSLRNRVATRGGLPRASIAVLPLALAAVACGSGRSDSGTAGAAASMAGAGGTARAGTGGTSSAAGATGGAGTTGMAGASGTTGAAGALGTCSATVACPAPLVCERHAGPVCADPAWAQWPMPNGVASGAPTIASYTDNGDDTITDNVTGLMWQKTVSTRRNVWNDAVAYCATLTLAGHGDWRLPTRVELISLLDLEKETPPNIDDVFIGTPASDFWTSSTFAGDPTFYAWNITFYAGVVSTAEKIAMSFSRCVR
jgi:hypothetical protein